MGMGFFEIYVDVDGVVIYMSRFFKNLWFYTSRKSSELFKLPFWVSLATSLVNIVDVRDNNGI